MARHNQQTLDFSGSIRPRATCGPTLLQHAESGFSKRNVHYILYLRSWNILEDNNDKKELIISEDGSKIVVVLAE